MEKGKSRGGGVVLKKLISIALIVSLITTSVPPRAVEASFLSDVLGAWFTVITAPIWIFCQDNPTFRKNNPFRKKIWEEERDAFTTPTIETTNTTTSPPRTERLSPPTPTIDSDLQQDEDLIRQRLSQKYERRQGRTEQEEETTVVDVSNPKSAEFDWAKYWDPYYPDQLTDRQKPSDAPTIDTTTVVTTPPTSTPMPTPAASPTTSSTSETEATATRSSTSIPTIKRLNPGEEIKKEDLASKDSFFKELKSLYSYIGGYEKSWFKIFTRKTSADEVIAETERRLKKVFGSQLLRVVPFSDAEIEQIEEYKRNIDFTLEEYKKYFKTPVSKDNQTETENQIVLLRARVSEQEESFGRFIEHNKYKVHIPEANPKDKWFYQRWAEYVVRTFNSPETPEDTFKPHITVIVLKRLYKQGYFLFQEYRSQLSKFLTPFLTPLTPPHITVIVRNTSLDMPNDDSLSFFEKANANKPHLIIGSFQSATLLFNSYAGFYVLESVDKWLYVLKNNSKQTIETAAFDTLKTAFRILQSPKSIALSSAFELIITKSFSRNSLLTEILPNLVANDDVPYMEGLCNYMEAIILLFNDIKKAVFRKETNSTASQEDVLQLLQTTKKFTFSASSSLSTRNDPTFPSRLIHAAGNFVVTYINSTISNITDFTILQESLIPINIGLAIASGSLIVAWPPLTIRSLWLLAERNRLHLITLPTRRAIKRVPRSTVLSLMVVSGILVGGICGIISSVSSKLITMKPLEPPDMSFVYDYINRTSAQKNKTILSVVHSAAFIGVEALNVAKTQRNIRQIISYDTPLHIINNTKRLLLFFASNETYQFIDRGLDVCKAYYGSFYDVKGIATICQGIQQIIKIVTEENVTLAETAAGLYKARVVANQSPSSSLTLFSPDTRYGRKQHFKASVVETLTSHKFSPQSFIKDVAQFVVPVIEWLGGNFEVLLKNQIIADKIIATGYTIAGSHKFEKAKQNIFNRGNRSTSVEDVIDLIEALSLQSSGFVYNVKAIVRRIHYQDKLISVFPCYNFANRALSKVLGNNLPGGLVAVVQIAEPLAKAAYILKGNITQEELSNAETFLFEQNEVLSHINIFMEITGFLHVLIPVLYMTHKRLRR